MLRHQRRPHLRLILSYLGRCNANPHTVSVLPLIAFPLAVAKISPLTTLLSALLLLVVGVSGQMTFLKVTNTPGLIVSGARAAFTWSMFLNRTVIVVFFGGP